MTAALFDVPGPKALARHRLYTIIGGVVVAAVAAFVLVALWRADQITPDRWLAFTRPVILGGLAKGLLETVLTAAVAIVLAIALGAAFAAGRLSEHRAVRLPCVALVEFFRAVPLLLLILFLFFGFGKTLGSFGALVVGLMFYNGAVLAEIFRAGMLAVPRGQSEAGYAIGLRKSQVMALVLAPQALRSMLPAIVSQCVVCLKDTALGFAVGAAGLVFVGRSIFISPLYDNPLAVGIVLAAMFIAINYSLSRLAQWLEARMRRQGRQVLPTTAIPDADSGSASTPLH